MAFKLLREQEPNLRLRLLVVPLVTFVDIDDGTPFESGDTSPFVIHNGKVGVKDMWKLDEGDVVMIEVECFEEDELRRAELVWMSVLTACADAFLRCRGVNGDGRRHWLSRNMAHLQDAVVAADQGESIDWIERSKEWKWTWPGGEE